MLSLSVYRAALVGINVKYILLVSIFYAPRYSSRYRPRYRPSNHDTVHTAMLRTAYHLAFGKRVPRCYHISHPFNKDSGRLVLHSIYGSSVALYVVFS